VGNVVVEVLSMKLVVKLLVVALVLIALAGVEGCTGCGYMLMVCDSTIWPYMDVTACKEYWGGYEPGQAYRLKADVFLFTGGRYFASELRAAGYHSQAKNPPPATVAEYRADPTQWPEYSHVIPAGTQVRVSRIYMKKDMPFTVLVVVADIIDGDVRKKEVALTWLSRGVDSGLWEPNPLVLERVVP